MSILLSAVRVEVDVRNGKESGQAAFGKAGGDSRHWATVGFPKDDRILEMAGLGSRSKTAKTAGN